MESSSGSFSLKRRDFLKKSAVVSATAALGTTGDIMAEESGTTNITRLKGRVNHSACRWCYNMPFDKLAAHAAKIGLKGLDLVDVNDWPKLKEYGLVCTMSMSHGITKGLNRKENHGECLDKIRKSIELTAEAGFPNVICFSGNRQGMDDDEGLKNCSEAVKQIAGIAEKKNVMICMELLNSKVNHKDYMCDHSDWGVELVRRVGSERFKLLYDIYHMQVQEGDIIATIRKYKDYFAHYHTGGVPGRNEIDETQELYYPAIIKAIIDTGFKGYLAQEFVPKRDPLKSLSEAVRICDV